MKHKISLYLFTILFTNFTYSSQSRQYLLGDIERKGTIDVFFVDKLYHKRFKQNVQRIAKEDYRSGQIKTFQDLTNFVILGDLELAEVVKSPIPIDPSFLNMLYESYTQEINSLKIIQNPSNSFLNISSVRLVPIRLALIDGVIIPVVEEKVDLVIPLISSLKPVVAKLRNGKIELIDIDLTNHNPPPILEASKIPMSKN